MRAFNLADLVNSLGMTVGGEPIIQMAYQFGPMLDEMGLSLIPVSVITADNRQYILPAVSVREVKTLLDWCSNQGRQQSKQELLALACIPSFVAKGLKFSGQNGLSEQDLCLISEGPKLAEAFSELGLTNSGLFFENVAKAHRGGYLEPFLLIEGFTDYPWVRPRPEDLANMPIELILTRVRGAAEIFRQILGEIQTLPELSQPAVWAMLRKSRNTFSCQPITDAISRALDLLALTKGAESLVEQLLSDLGTINSISARYAIYKALKT
jgi:hypothetical protein